MARLPQVSLAIILGAASPAVAEPKLIYGVFWEGCEGSCQGFRETIEASGLDAEFIARDARQDRNALPGFVVEARELGADLVLTFGTTVTLVIAGTLDDDPSGTMDDIPLVFMYVADPFGTRIAESFEGSGRPHVTGTYNRVPEEVNLRTIQTLMPDFERLGMLYNQSEANSVLKVDELESLSATMGFELVALEVDLGSPDHPDPALIPGRVADLAEAGVDFIYVGSSSYLSANGQVFTAAALEEGLPVLSPYEELVRDNDALVSIAARAYDVGRVAAEQTLRILRDGETPGDLPIARVTDFAYVINTDVAEELGLYPPIELLQVAETVD